MEFSGSPEMAMFAKWFVPENSYKYEIEQIGT